MHSLSLSSCTWHLREAGTKKAYPARVPGCVHTDLHAAGLIPDPFWSTNELALQWIEEKDWEYACDFSVPAELLAEDQLDLVFDGLDTLATVLLNDEPLGTSSNMFVRNRWPLGSRLRKGANRLVVRFANTMKYLRDNYGHLEQGELNDPKGLAPGIRKQQCQYGWDWGPRLVTAGIWRDLRLEAWSGNRIESVQVHQEHHKDGSVTLSLTPELARQLGRGSCSATLSLRGTLVGRFEKGSLTLANPELWWPNNLGTQALYELELTLHDAKERQLDVWRRRIGLRTIKLDRHKDKAGETFQFLVNGIPVFAKGANWIPAHSFVANLGRREYERDLLAAKRANMNMVRIWGGGIYEGEDFYDLCDELGLLVWQDFMFACALYPGDKDFVASVSVEAEQQVRRLRHHASLALWCGNNECEQLNVQRLKKPAIKRAYRDVFERLLPRIVREVDGLTDYWPSSQHRPDGDNTHAAGEKHGDTHYWDVWHARHPVKDYERWRFRFCSEFGMQSYSSAETNATFCPPEDNNLLGPSMENHQKNRGGNQVILDYVTRRYRFPRSQEDFIYLSQLNQAYCMQIGVEHFRRLMPHCMGALYWQLNDCWPVASWSSIEHTGRWRALHHVARRFFAPLLVSASIPQEETAGTGNYRLSTLSSADIFTVCDLPGTTKAVLSWQLRHIDGRIILKGRKALVLNYGESVNQHTLELATAISRHSRDRLYLRLRLEAAGQPVSEETFFLAPPRFVDLPKGPITIGFDAISDTCVRVTLESKVFQHRVCLELPGLRPFMEDNFVELYPDEPKSFCLHFTAPVSIRQLQSHARLRSLADTY